MHDGQLCSGLLGLELDDVQHGFVLWDDDPQDDGQFCSEVVGLELDDVQHAPLDDGWLDGLVCSGWDDVQHQQGTVQQDEVQQDDVQLDEFQQDGAQHEPQAWIWEVE